MYTAVLMAMMTTSTASPSTCLMRGHGGYSCAYNAAASNSGGYDGHFGYACYACYSCYSPYGCYGCSNPVHVYGCAGAYFRGGFSFPVDPHYYMGGCYGCYGGYKGYGIPVQDTTPVRQPDAKEPLPKIIVPGAGEKKEKGSESFRAQMRIEIPEGGRLFVDGQAIAVKPGVCSFQTPPLAAGQAFYYELRIEVQRAGTIHTEERRVVVHSGDELAVNFSNLPASATQTASSGSR